MRLSEAFEIDGEQKERGVRYVVVGKKTDQSLRRVPLPAAVLPYLPKSIKEPLFALTKHKDPSDAASKRLNRFLMTSALRTRARWRIRYGTAPRIGYARPDAPKMSGGPS